MSRAAMAFEEGPGLARGLGIVGVVSVPGGHRGPDRLPASARVPAAALIVSAALALKIFGMQPPFSSSSASA